MQKTLLLTLMLVLCIAVDAIVHETGNLEQFLFGSETASEYDNWISHVSENIADPGMNHYAPWDRQTTGFGSFLEPDANETNLWSQAITLFFDGAYDQAQQVLTDSGIPYKIVQFDDTQTGKTYYILRETLNDDIDDNGTEDTSDDEIGSFDFGWGIFIYDPGSLNPVIVSAPHPCDDFPSPLMAWEAFKRWNARWLMINGAGREVAFTGSSYNNNNQSLSDPSRNPDHPFNIVYQMAADDIRNQFGREEFSAQIHTYDPFRPGTQRDVQLSAGNGRSFPTLPIRDLSRSKNDIIHNTPFLIHPEGAFGNDAPVTIPQYYSVYYAQGGSFYYTGNGMNISISNNRDYPGYAQNCQMYFTEQTYYAQAWNPFFHVEMAELPQSLSHDEATLARFYGYDSETETWNPAQRYTRFKAYYMPWLNAMTASLPAMLRLDDGQIPSTPYGLCVNPNPYFSLGWQRSYAYDFESYEIHYCYTLNGEVHYGLYDRDDDVYMGQQNYTLVPMLYMDLYQLPTIVTYRVRARDVHGNYSEFSNPLSFSWPSNKINSLNLTPMYDRNFISWTGESSSVSTLGYIIYRSGDGYNFSIYDSYLTNPVLSPENPNLGTYSDLAVIPGKAYYYKICRVYSDGTEYLHYAIVKGSPLISDPLFATNLTSGQQTTFYFGTNALATNAVDQVLDQSTTGVPNSPYFLLCSTAPNNTTYLTRDLRPVFAPRETFITFDLVMRCPSPGMDYVISLPDSVIAGGDRFLLLDMLTGTWTDLSNGNYTLTGVMEGTRAFRFYWGHYLPELSLPPATDIYALPRQHIPLSWQVSAALLVDHIQVVFANETQELTLFDSLPATFTGVDLTVPPNLPILTGRIGVILHLTDGSSVRADYPWLLRIVTASFALDYDPGIHFLSFPTLSMYSTMMDVFGGECAFWRFGEDGIWHYNEELTSGQAYLAAFEQAHHSLIPNVPVTQEYSRILRPGLNFVPNPHQRDYRFSELIFRRNDSAQTPITIPANTEIFPYFIVLRNGNLTLSPNLRQGEAGFIRISTPDTLSLSFDPYIQSSSGYSLPGSWQVDLSAVQGTLSASCRIGSSVNPTDDPDPLYDLPHTWLPELPGSQTLSLNLFHPQDPAHVPYYCRYTGLYPYYDTVTRYWQIEADLPTNRAVTWLFASEDIPDGYRITLDLDGQHFEVEPNLSFTFQPSAPGIIHGSISVTSNAPVENIDQVELLRRISVYPNPSREVLHLRVPKQLRGKLDLAIYNIRGQLVRRFGQDKTSDSDPTLWDGRDEQGMPCAAGIYFLRAVSGTKSQTIKFLRL